MFLRQILIIAGVLLFTGGFAFPADIAPTLSKAETLANIGRELTVDISRFAVDGDAEMARLLETYQLKGDVDWKVMVKDLLKMETMFQDLCADLLRLQEHNDHIRSIVVKFDIKQQPSTTTPPK